MFQGSFLTPRISTVFGYLRLLEDTVLHKGAWNVQLLGTLLRIKDQKKVKFSRRDISSLEVKGLKTKPKLKCMLIISSFIIFSLNSYYPLHPTHEDVNMDYEHFEEYGYMPITPDVLVVPSDLRYFVKVKITFPKIFI